MLKIKTVIVCVLLSSVAALSFAQTPAALKSKRTLSRAAASAPAGSTAKPKHRKVANQATKQQKVRQLSKKPQKSQPARGGRSAAPGLQAY